MAMLQTEAGCHSHQARGYLARGTGHAEDSHCLFGVYGPLRNSRRVYSAAKACVEKRLKEVQAGLGIPRTEARGDSQINGEPRYDNLTGCVGGRLNKGIVGL